MAITEVSKYNSENQINDQLSNTTGVPFSSPTLRNSPSLHVAASFPQIAYCKDCPVKEGKFDNFKTANSRHGTNGYVAYPIKFDVLFSRDDLVMYHLVMYHLRDWLKLLRTW